MMTSNPLIGNTLNLGSTLSQSNIINASSILVESTLLLLCPLFDEPQESWFSQDLKGSTRAIERVEEEIAPKTKSTETNKGD